MKCPLVTPHDAKLIAVASSFTASLFLGRGSFDKIETRTLAEARAATEKLRAAHPRCTREPMVYANAEGASVFVPAGYEPEELIIPAFLPRRRRRSPEPPVPPVRALREPKASPPGKRAAIEQAAAAGEVPKAPNFEAQTHRNYRKTLAAIEALVLAGDLAGLQAFECKDYDSSWKAITRYRNLAMIALEVRAACWHRGLPR